ncbi:MAG: asparagine synthase-related protein [Flavobacteriaceae bacterium]|nr:asparagine synthetase B family protein [Flavobacteriaceae bacterium]
MPKTQTPIIPHTPTFAKVAAPHEWNKEAICVFVATGFFLDTDTFWCDELVIPPATDYELGDHHFLSRHHSWFQWHYTPRNISFEEALEEFTELFESILDRQVKDEKVILPLSGGLDSRTQAAGLAFLGKNVSSYSYEFKEGYPETKIAQKIAAVCEFPFQKFTIQKGYLWDCIEELANINGCYSEFTHPRQMAIAEYYKEMGSIFSLGHWGDVLFDRGAPEGILPEDALALIKKKVVKKGGMELAEKLWQAWGLPGRFETYFEDRLQTLWNGIAIENVSAKMRAFKSLYWAPRWTSTNLAIFEEKRPVTLPYYSNEMCQFICTIPEAYLADRKLQIAYLKKRNPSLARITWEAKKPFHLYNFHKHKTLSHVPYRIVNKLQREVKKMTGNSYIQRNWELQFLGKENAEKLAQYLFSESLTTLVPKNITEEFYQKFKAADAVYYSHPVSMLLTLALKTQQNGAH